MLAEIVVSLLVSLDVLMFIRVYRAYRRVRSGGFAGLGDGDSPQSQP